MMYYKEKREFKREVVEKTWEKGKFSLYFWEKNIKKTKKYWIRIRNTELYTNPECRKRVAGSDVREPPDPGQVQDEVNTGPQHR